jgi:cbb3-type cytochrome oxidase maturation protein
MPSPMEGQTFLFMWIGFLLLMTGCIAAFFLWAIRAGQFSQQDRARYLPLKSGIPQPEAPDTQHRQEQGRHSS